MIEGEFDVAESDYCGYVTNTHFHAVTQSCTYPICFLFLISPVQKLQERQATLKMCTLPERQKEKWSKVIISDMMSSEESDADDETIIIKPLPWRAPKVTEFFQNIDTVGAEGKTTQAKHQRKQRVISSAASLRPKPAVTVPSWAYIS